MRSAMGWNGAVSRGSADDPAADAPAAAAAGGGAAHDALLERGRRLELLTIAWNVMEVFVTVGLGVATGSLALIAFGLDSLVEVFASVVVISYIGHHHAEGRAQRAMRLVAVAFAFLGTYLLVASTYNLASRDVADSSPLGVVYLAVTAAVMFGLAIQKRILARAAHSGPLGAEANVTFLDGCLATSILVALIVNAAWGIWWADPAAALLVALFCFREAVVNWSAARTKTAEDLA
jgi:divalent metal cation (Fe/Co/Zn/Cd) transporter